ncbi:MAG: hypothetical protein SNJ68_03950, partial [Cyanobacteriota bacterium]
GLTFMNSVIIITAADSKFFDLVQGTILSIRDKPEGRSVDLGFFDLGCTPEQLEWISGQVNHIVEPGWDYDVPGIETAPSYLRGLLARPFLPKYFPGYEIYVWIDADAWVQDWFAVDLLIRGARKGSVALVPELDRALIGCVKPTLVQSFGVYNTFFGKDIAEKIHVYPTLNAGVFAISFDSFIWKLWSQNITKALNNRAIASKGENMR